MRVDLNMATEQARRIQRNADDLRDARRLLLSFQETLNRHWRGEELVNINNAINATLRRILESTIELDEIAPEIIAAAQEIRRQEELADAQAALAREDAHVAGLRTAFESAQRQHSIDPAPATQAALNTAQTDLNNAMHTRNDAAARVRALI